MVRKDDMKGDLCLLMRQIELEEMWMRIQEFVVDLKIYSYDKY